MSKTKKRIETRVDTSLVQQMQARVAGVPMSATSAAPVGTTDSLKDTHSEAVSESVPDPRPSANRQATGHERPRGASPRTALTVPLPIGRKARQLTMALTLSEARQVSIGETLAAALDLLQRELERDGVEVPSGDVKLRSAG